MKRLTTLFLVLVIVLALPMSAALAQGGDEPPTPIDPDNIPELPALLGMLAGPQGWVALGVLVSMLFAKWPWYNMLASEPKIGLFLTAVTALAVLAYCAITFIPASFWVATKDIWGIIAGVIMTWMGGNGAYLMAVKPHKKRKELPA